MVWEALSYVLIRHGRPVDPMIRAVAGYVDCVTSMVTGASKAQVGTLPKRRIVSARFPGHYCVSLKLPSDSEIQLGVSKALSRQHHDPDLAAW